jgi:hypothetical protein
MSRKNRVPESAWLLDGLGAALLVLGAVAAGVIGALVWLAVGVPV